MRTRKINNSRSGFLLILLILVVFALMKGPLNLAAGDGRLCGENVFVQVSGDVAQPGVYGFTKVPDIKKLLIRAGGLLARCEPGRISKTVSFDSGTDVCVLCREKGVRLIRGEMSSFYRITLGVPVSLNMETQEGLTAIPGIGPEIAGAIVRERGKRGGFRSLDDILAIKGIGPSLYGRIGRYLVL